MPTYFNFIPDDIHAHIAYQLYSSIPFGGECGSQHCYIHSLKDGKELDSLLNYAEEGPAQKRSVMSAMSHRLHITGQWRSERVVDWISSFADELQELDISEAPHVSFPGTPSPLPKLGKATIVSESEQLSLIHRSPKLSELIVSLSDTKQWDSLVSTISSLPLKTLQLQSSQRLMLTLSRNQLMSLRQATAGVENFYLDSRATPAVWDTIKEMPSLKKLKVLGGIKNEQIPFVQNLSELGLYRPPEIDDLSPLGSVLRSLIMSFHEREGISRLANLSKLGELRVKVAPGLERFLVGAIDSVENLSLSWSYEKCNEYVEGISGGPHSYREYYEPDEVVLKNIVRSATHLKSLHIKNAILSAQGIRGLLQIRGNQLETLKISHDWQWEDAPTRMESILKDVPRYCPNLKTLNFLEGCECYELVPIFAEKEQSTKCFHALKGVLEAIPGFKSYRHIRNIIEHRFTDQRNMGILTWDLLP